MMQHVGQSILALQAADWNTKHCFICMALRLMLLVLPKFGVVKICKQLKVNVSRAAVSKQVLFSICHSAFNKYSHPCLTSHCEDYYCGNLKC